MFTYGAEIWGIVLKFDFEKRDETLTEIVHFARYFYSWKNRTNFTSNYYNYYN